MGGEAMVHVGGHLYSSLQFISDVLGGVLNRVVSPSFALHAFATAGNVNSMENILKGTVFTNANAFLFAQDLTEVLGYRDQRAYHLLFFVR